MNTLELLNSYKDGNISTDQLRKHLAGQHQDENRRRPLSEGQKGLWMLWKSAPDSWAYNVPVCFKTENRLDTALFQRACTTVFAQHRLLNNEIEEVDGVPWQFINQQRPIRVDIQDLSALDEPAVIAEVQQEARRPFQLINGPLARVSLFELGGQSSIVLFTFHHIIFDGGSAVTLLEALARAYGALSRGETPICPSLVPGFYDFVDEERQLLDGEEGARLRAYWREQLAGDLPVLALPGGDESENNQPAAAQTDRQTITLSPALRARVEEFCARQGVNPPALFLGIYALVLHAWSGQEEVMVGMPTFGRQQEKYDEQIGYFINMLPMRIPLCGETVFSDFLTQLRVTLLDGLEHAACPFPVMVRDCVTRGEAHAYPLFQTAFFYHNHLPLKQRSAFLECFASPGFIDEIEQQGEYPLTMEVFELEDDFRIGLRYDAHRYPATMITRMASQWITLLETFVGQPDIPIKHATLLTAAEEKQILSDWNATQRAWPHALCVHEMIERQANRTPDAIAAVYQGETLSYRQLMAKSTCLANYLRSLGVMPGERVGVCVRRSLDLLVGLLGVLKAGAAYVALDPELPAERRHFISQDSGIRMLVTQRGLVMDAEVRTAVIDEWQSIAQANTEFNAAQAPANPASLAYVLYTSGTTGQPKGVMVSHRALTNFLLSMAETPGISAGERLLAVTTYSFDIAALELYLPLIQGAECHICGNDAQKDMAKLRQEIARVRPDIMQATPGTWMMLFRLGWRNEEKVRILCGGETLPQHLQDDFARSGSEVWNMFGPTETTIWSTIKKLEYDGPITIGRPIVNTQVYILNAWQQPVPVGMTGELYIGGDGLAEGYFNRPALTEEKFIVNPFRPGTRLYRTGDLARWLENGEIVCLGRQDNQIKIRGFRVELGEIEACLNRYPGVQNCAVVVRETEDGQRLAAFYVTGGEERPDDGALRAYLARHLARYMIPSRFIALAALPLTPNGKTDRAALLRRSEREEGDCRVAAHPAESGIQDRLLAIWRSTIGNPSIALDDGFFQAGGDSLSAVIIAEKVSAALSCEISVTTLFEYASIRALSRHIAQNAAGQQGNAAVNIRSARPLAEPSPQALPDDYRHNVAVIGMSCQFPGADNPAAFWNNLLEGRESIRHLDKGELLAQGVSPQMAARPDYVPVSATVAGKSLFDPEFFMLSPKDAALMDPQARLLLLNAWWAVEDAGYAVPHIPNTAVYMSVSTNFYQQPDLTQARVLENSAGYVSWLYSQSGTVPALISYHLGLTGPSYAIHSNCSSALSGLYAAYQSLRAGEVEYALVGAATLHSADSLGYIHQPGLNFSADGRLKAFDTAADGMVGSEGVAVLLLKNAHAAIRDNDAIYGLLRGIAMNNDGMDKAGFYAPGVRGQAAVIEKALQVSGVAPETVGYVEAHGTGTRLGDPIEIAALSGVFRRYTDKIGFCGIGSVKTNIGHTDTVAGLAGCIKVLHALHHGQIPASLHYREANPEMHLETSPFYVVDQLTDWPAAQHPRRAALSSFGIGGTNVHAIFEAYSANAARPQPSRLAQYIIPLSAKNAARLAEYATRLQAFLTAGENDDCRLDELASTLQLGRSAMACRVAFLVTDKEELIQKLTAYTAGERHIVGVCYGETQPTSELLRQLEGDEETDTLVASWIERQKFAKLATLWCQGLNLDWTRLYGSVRPRRVRLPGYPFARHSCWRAAPASPQARRDVETLSTRLRATADNEFHLTLSGEDFFLAGHVINGNKVLPGVMYIELARAAGERWQPRSVRKIRRIVWARPIIVEQHRDIYITLAPGKDLQEAEYTLSSRDEGQPVIHAQGSLVYGDEASPAAMCDIAEHLARCPDKIEHEALYRDMGRGAYDYSSSFRPIGEMCFSASEVVASINMPVERQQEAGEYVLHPSLLEGGLQSISGIAMARGIAPYMPFSIEELEIFYPLHQSCYALTTLAEEPTEHALTKYHIQWVDPQGKVLARARNYTVRAIKSEEESGVGVRAERLWYHETLIPTVAEEPAALPIPGLLVFGAEGPASAAIERSVLIAQGEHFNADAAHCFRINPKRYEDYQALLRSLVEQGVTATHIIFAWPLAHRGDDGLACLDTGLHALCHLHRALAEQGGNVAVNLLYLYSDDPLTLPFNRAIRGFLRTLRQESSGLRGKTLQFPSRPGQDWQQAVHQALAEYQMNDGDDVVYSADHRYIRQPEEIVPTDGNPVAGQSPFRRGGVFVITGGTGKIAALIAMHLADVTGGKLVLIGRRASDRQVTELTDRLSALGAEVLHIVADISQPDQMDSAYQQVKARFGAVHGIIHCAGVIDDRPLIDKSPVEIARVLAPKVGGTLNLDHSFRDEPLDFFLLFSSVSRFGNAGQADYAYANDFIEGFAASREALRQREVRFGKTLCISWPLWHSGGMRPNEQILALMGSARGMLPMPTEIGLQALREGLLSEALRDCCQLTLFYGDAAKIRKTFARHERAEVIANTPAPYEETLDGKALLGRVLGYLLDTAAAALEITDISADRDMQSYGFDSISNTELANSINRHYGLDMMPTVFFELEAPTLRSLASYLCQHYAQGLQHHYRHQAGRQENPRIALEPAASLPTIRPAAAERPVADMGDKEPIAIVGISGIFPGSESLEAFWRALQRQESLIAEIPADRFDWREFEDPCMRWGGFMRDVAGFDADFFDISLREAQVIDPQHRLLLQAAWHAIEDAGDKPSALSGSKTGVFVGIGTQDYSDVLHRNLKEPSPWGLTGKTPFMAANRISSLLNLHGPSEPIDTACSSSLVAIHRAVESLHSGSCEMAIAAGVNVILSPSIHASFSAAGMLSPGGECRTFDGEANGTVRGEGVGAIFLKPMRTALSDGNPIYALIRSSAENHKGKSHSLTAPNANAQAALLVEAYRRAGIAPDSVSYIETHSTGTKLGDPVEVNGLKKAFTQLYQEQGLAMREASCGLGSLKSNIGHLEAAAGVAAVIKVLLALKHRVLPGMAHFNALNPYISLKNTPFYIIDSSRPWHPHREGEPRRAGVSAFGFGGVGCHVVLEEYLSAATPLIQSPSPALMVLSARNATELEAQARQLRDELTRDVFTQSDLLQIAWTLQSGREAMDTRLAFCAETLADIPKMLEAFLAGEHHDTLYYGVREVGSETSAELSGDEDIGRVITSWLEKKRYDRLLAMWVKGWEIDWRRLYDSPPQRISLPGYPFAATRCWVTLTEQPHRAINAQQSVQAQGSQSEDDGRDMLVVGLIAGLLGITADEIDISAPLETLKLDSIVLMQLFVQLQKRDPALDYESLLACHSISEIISALSPAVEQVKKRPGYPQPDNRVFTDFPELIRLNRPADEKPVFWFHGGFGGLGGYQFIAQKTMRPFYGIQARGYMTDDPPISGVAEMAAYYRRIIQRVQPEGPYDLGGLSMGGTIAYEVTRQLQEQGQDVSTLVMLETMYVDEAIRSVGATPEQLANFNKDRIFRAINFELLSAGITNLLNVTDVDLTLSDEAFLSEAIGLAKQRGMSKSAQQLRLSLERFIRVNVSLDISDYSFDILPLPRPEALKCYYFRRAESQSYGALIENFSLNHENFSFNSIVFTEKWEKQLPVFTLLEVKSDSHLTMLFEPESQKFITDFCADMYRV